MPPRRSSREQVLNQPRSGARPLGGSPGPARPPRDAGSRADVRAARERYRSGRSPEADERLRREASARSDAAQDRERQRERERREMTGGSRRSGGPRSSIPDQDDRKSSSPGRQRKQRNIPGAPRRTRGGGEPGKTPQYHNYQAIVLAEFVAAELLVAATPIATRKNQPGLSPYVPRDLVKLLAIGATYFILQLLASGGRGGSRLSAWFGGLVLLAVGLNEASKLGAVFDTLTGGSGSSKTTAVLTAKAGTADAPLTSYTQPELGQPPPGASGETSAGRRKMGSGEQVAGPPQTIV